MMIYAKLGFATTVLATTLAMTTGAHAICSNNWADVTAACPQPAPYTGPKHLTASSRNLPTVGYPAGTIVNWGHGITVRYVKGTSREAGRQPFYYQK